MDGIREITDSSIFLLVLTSFLAGVAIPIVGIIIIRIGEARERNQR